MPKTPPLYDTKIAPFFFLRTLTHRTFNLQLKILCFHVWLYSVQIDFLDGLREFH